MMREPRKPVSRRRRRLRDAHVLPMLAAATVAMGVMPAVLAAPLTPEQLDKIIPKAAMMSIADCSAELFEAQATRSTEQDRVGNACRLDLSRKPRHVSFQLATAEELPWVSCKYGVASDGYRRTKPVDGPCAAHFSLNEVSTHIRFAVWTTSKSSAHVVFTFEPMIETIEGFSVLTQAGRDYWNTSPWVECNVTRDSCKEIPTPAEPPVDRPGG